MIEGRVKAARTAEQKLDVIAEELDRLLAAQFDAHKPAPAKRTVGKPVVTFSEEVGEVFDYWRERLNRPRATLTRERREKVEARLRQSYTVARIKRAIDGCHGSDFHMARGEHHGRNQHVDLTLICRTGSKLEEFEQMPKRGGGTSKKFLG